MANAFVNKIYSFFQWLWFEYTIFTALYMLGHREKIAFTSCLVVIIATASYSTYVFLPHYLSSLISYFAGSAENTPQQVS